MVLIETVQTITSHVKLSIAPGATTTLVNGAGSLQPSSKAGLRVEFRGVIGFGVGLLGVVFGGMMVL